MKKSIDNIKALLSSESTEWYTPARYVNAAREVMGGIDCDPASNDMANRVVRATTYYTKETNGYDKPWYGRVWLNPPYGHDDKKGNQSRWSQRLIEQYQAGITTQAILLVNSMTERKWFKPLTQFPICFTDHRVQFYSPNERACQPTCGNAFIYLGPHKQKFVEVFSQFGVILARVSTSPVTLWTMEDEQVA